VFVFLMLRLGLGRLERQVPSGLMRRLDFGPALFVRQFCAAPLVAERPDSKPRPFWKRPKPPPFVFRPSHQDPRGLKGALALTKEDKGPLYFEHPNPNASVDLVTLPEDCVTDGPNGLNAANFDKFAVVAINKKQFKVTVGDRVMVDLMTDTPVGTVLTFDQVLVVGSAHKSQVGRPLLPDTTVKAEVQEHPWLRDRIVFHRRRRKTYKRTYRVKTQVTILQILDIDSTL